MTSATERKEALNYLDAREMGEHLRMGPRAIIRYTKMGIIPSIRIGRRYFYDLESVHAALVASEVRPA